MTMTAPQTATGQRLTQGNEACAFGALYAGCNFFAGYPITPSSEVMEQLSRELPKRGGVFIQMEDEIASISAIIGAAWSGAKVMTATSGPGFSLMQEGLGYASMTETPCVIVDAQRGGPSTGLPTSPSQGDLMQAIWGTHGDHPVVVLTASTVRDIFEMTVTAFNTAERYRVPVVLLLDEVLAHMRENILWPEPGELPVVERARPKQMQGFKPFGREEFLPFGEGVRFNVTGLGHDEAGLPAGGAETARLLMRAFDRLQTDLPRITRYRTHRLEDAEIVLISFGITSRAAESAVAELRTRGVAAGLLDLKTLWPFPEHLIQALPASARAILVPELNLGQLVREVSRSAYQRYGHEIQVESLSRIDGRLITSAEIVERVHQLAQQRLQRRST